MAHLSVIFALFIVHLSHAQLQSAPPQCDADPGKGGKVASPATTLRLTEKAIKYADSLFVEQIANAIGMFDVPDYNIATLKVHSLKLTLNQPLNASYFRAFEAPNKIRWGFRAVPVTATAKALYTLSIPQAKNYTSEFEGTGNVSLNAVTYMTRDGKGRPYSVIGTCAAKIEVTNIKFSGEFTEDDFPSKPAFDFVVRAVLANYEAAICFIVRAMNMVMVNKLATYQAKIPLQFKNLFLNYGLSGNPRFSTDLKSIEGFPQGNSYFKDSLSNVLFYPQPLAQSAVKDEHMLQFSISEYVLNTLFSTAHQNNMLKLVVDQKSTISPNVTRFLRLDCASGEFCVGRLFDKASTFNSSNATITLQTTAAPIAQINPENSFWTGKGKLEIVVVDKGIRKTLFTADLRCVCGTLEPILDSNYTLLATSKVKHIDIRPLSNLVAPTNTALPPEALEKLKSLVLLIVEEAVNYILQTGIPAVPLVKGVTLRNATLQVLPRTFYVSSDLVYSG